MVKISNVCIWKPFGLIFRSCLESGTFPLDRTKVNVDLAHKKGNKQILKVNVQYLCFLSPEKFLKEKA